MDKEISYEQAIQRLETIAQQLERGEMPIDEMAARLREAQDLLRQCRQQLYAADEAVQQILSNDASTGGTGAA